jgi:hypothetical protein
MGLLLAALAFSAGGDGGREPPVSLLDRNDLPANLACDLGDRAGAQQSGDIPVQIREI